MTKKTEICTSENCSLPVQKCLKAHSALDWYPSKDLYIKYPGKWDCKHREQVAKKEGLEFPKTVKEVKDSLSYYHISKIENEVEQHLQFFLPRNASVQEPEPAKGREPTLSFECCADECSSPYIDPINEELEKLRIEYEEKIRIIKERPRRQLELLQEQEVLKEEIQAMVLKVNDFKERWAVWFKPGDARLVI